jgi:NAD(P)-dependent dehydrogenase (short-subunit alcohol dehydrogenase family)
MTGIITHKNFDLSDTPDLSTKVAVITSGQAGIGREVTAQPLLHRIAAVYILARTESNIQTQRQWAEKGGLSKDNLDTRTLSVRCDLRDIADVNRVADHLLTKPDRLNILINDAGRPECAVLAVLAET